MADDTKMAASQEESDEQEWPLNKHGLPINPSRNE